MRTLLTLSLLTLCLILVSPTPAAATDPDGRFQLGLLTGVAFEKDHAYVGFELEAEIAIGRHVVPFIHVVHYRGTEPRTNSDDAAGVESIDQLNMGALFAWRLRTGYGLVMRPYLRAGVGFEFYNDGLNDDNSTCLAPVLTLGGGLRLRLTDHFSVGVELDLLKYPFSDDVINMVKPTIGLWVNF